jgi:iron complex outermembrane receptor protein
MPTRSCVFAFPIGARRRMARIARAFSRSTDFASAVSRTLVACFVLIMLVAAAYGQATSSLSGTIKDPTGAVVSKAVITLTEDKTAAKRSTVSSDSGMYTFTDVAPGSCSIEAMAEGFSVFGSKITIGTSPTTLDVALELAGASTAVSVEAKIDPFNILPTQPTQSIFGFDQKLEDIPRSISTADQETLLRYDVKTVNDIMTVSSGAFTGSYFGIAGSVFLRGDVGDNFFRGFRRVENRGNYETPISASDHIEIVKGPPSPIYGGGRVGGFMNFYPKSTRSESAKWLEKVTGKVSLTYGSYDEKRGSAEVGVPFKLGTHRSGLYAFFEAEDTHSFYKGVGNRYKLGQIAFDTEASKKLRFAYGFQGFHDEGTQNIGWNRVTQNLVDNQMYLSGQPLVNVSRNGYNIGVGDITPYSLTTFAYQQNMAITPDYKSVANLYALNPATVKLVKLPLDQIMIDAGDFSRATTFTPYFDAIYDFSPNVHFKNQTFGDYLEHQKYSSYGFAAGYHPWTIENKSTIMFEYRPTHAITAHILAGFGYRYVRVTAGEERNAYQVVDRRDLSIGTTANDRFAGPYNSNGLINFQYYQNGSYGDTGLFWLSDISLGSKLTATVGVRFDRYTPDFMGQDDFDSKLTHATAANNAVTYNASVGYRLPFNLRPYFTAATSRFLDLGQGNELDYAEILNNTYIATSNLYEGGVKTSAMDNKVFATVSMFRQKRTSFNNQTHSQDYFRTTGVEAEARAFLFKRLSLTGAFTWQNPEQLNVPFLLGIPPTLLGLTPQQAYGGRFIGDASIFGLKAPFPVGGQPHFVVSPFATVNITKNIGFTFGTSWVSSVKTGYVSSVTLPSYFVTRGSVFYQRGKNLINLSTNNMFDQVYFQSQYLFWDVFIKPGALRTASLTYSYTF